MTSGNTFIDYRFKVWHPQTMEPRPCNHTLNHLTDNGFLNGSWTTDKTEHGDCVVCESCGKFYGYLPKHATLPPRRPGSITSSSSARNTGSSSCSGVREPVGEASGDAREMARVAEKKAKRAPIDFAELRRRVSIGQVLQLVEFSPVSRSGAQVRGRCPVHRSENPKSRSFSANLERNTYQCFSRSCGSKGNQVDLYVAVTGLLIYDAALSLCEKLGIEVPWKEVAK